MAFTKEGFLGHFSGKLGNTVVYEMRTFLFSLPFIIPLMQWPKKARTIFQKASWLVKKTKQNRNSP